MRKHETEGRKALVLQVVVLVAQLLQAILDVGRSLIG